MKFTWNPHANQISSRSSRLKFPLGMPLLIIQDVFMYLTPLSLPDLTTATHALWSISFLVNCSSDLAKIG